jgi:sugar/nucleoside kinase (ribokinase family)
MNTCTDDNAIDIYNYEIGCENLFVTLGGSGALFTNGSDIERHHVIKSTIADTIGAGDTFFAFASIIAHLNISNEDKLKIPSLAASLSTTWICNEESVTKEKLIKYAHQKV